MPLPLLETPRVEDALRQYDSTRPEGEAESWRTDDRYRYFISSGDQLYPVKEVAAIAAGLDTTRGFNSQEAVRRLKVLGYNVIERDRSATKAHYWWVNQGTTYNQESSGGYVWAPLRHENGTTWGFWTNVGKLSVGDHIIHYANSHIRAVSTVAEAPVEASRPGELPETQWQKDGRLARTAYEPLIEPININDVPIDWRVEEGNPFDRDGAVKQGYLFPVSGRFCERIEGLFPEKLAGLVVEDDQPEPLRFVVAAIGNPSNADAVVKRMREMITTRGMVADWWSFPLQPEHQAALAKAPWVYLYLSEPSSSLAFRLHVTNFETSSGSDGIESPWPDDTYSELVGIKRAGERNDQIFKTWFLVDRVEDVSPPIPHRSLQRPDGSAAFPAALRNAFSVWEMKASQGASLSDLATRTHMPSTALSELGALLEEKKQVILEGPPGTGKTFLARRFASFFTGNSLDAEPDQRVRVVQFHQSYGYEEFIQGIRPETNAAGQIEYYLRPGVFMDFCLLASRNPEKKFVLIIDEINRGNISRIFGELLYLLEYREERVPLANSKPDEEAFSIPTNVYILGTMNTTDRSLAQIDYALRRRFFFYRLMPVEHGHAPVLESWLRSHGIPENDCQRIMALFLSLNARIADDLGEHFQVGHSYFMHPDIHTEDRLDRVWRHAILPLLEEYFHGRRDMTEHLDGFRLDRLMQRQATEARSDDPADDPAI